MSEASQIFKRKAIIELIARIQQGANSSAKVRQAELKEQPGYKAMLADPEYIRLVAKFEKVSGRYRTRRRKWNGKLHEELTPLEQRELDDLSRAEADELQAVYFKINELKKDYGLVDPVDLRSPLQRLLDKCLRSILGSDATSFVRLHAVEYASLAAHLEASKRESELHRDPQMQADLRRLEQVLIYNRELNKLNAVPPTSALDNIQAEDGSWPLQSVPKAQSEVSGLQSTDFVAKETTLSYHSKKGLRTPMPSDWPKRPFDPACLDRVPRDQATMNVVRRCITDWDGENWIAVYEYLREAGRTPDELNSMDVFSVRMAFATGQVKMVNLLGKPETTTGTVLRVDFGERGARSAGSVTLSAFSRLFVDLQRETATLDGIAYSVSADQAIALQRLLEAKGSWRNGKELRADPEGKSGRPDRVIAKLPSELRALIQSGGPKGYRLIL